MIGEGAVTAPETEADEFSAIEEVEIADDEISIEEPLEEPEPQVTLQEAEEAKQAETEATEKSPGQLTEDILGDDIEIKTIDLDEPDTSPESIQVEPGKEEQSSQDDVEIDSMLDSSILKEGDGKDDILSPEEAGDIEQNLEAELKIDDLFSAIAGDSASNEMHANQSTDGEDQDVFMDITSEFDKDMTAAATTHDDEITDEDMASMLTTDVENHTVEEEEDLVSQIFDMPEDVEAKDLMFQLEEVDFYIDQEFYEEAKAKLRDLQQKYPNNPGVKKRVQTLAEKAADSEIQKFHEEFSEFKGTPVEKSDAGHLEEAPTTAGAAAEESTGTGDKPTGGLHRNNEPIEASTPVFSDDDLFKEEEDFFNITSEIENEISIPTPTTSVNLEAQLESVFDEFRDEVSTSVGEDDAETRYNLGIAYKEMDLIDEAIQEFQAAAKNKEAQLKSSTMLGYCFMEKQLPVQAAQWFQKALSSVREDTPQNDVLGIRFALAQAYMANGNSDEAINELNSIMKVDANYPGVQGLIKQLQ